MTPPSLFTSIASVTVSFIAIVFMGILLHNNSGALLNNLVANIATLFMNSSEIVADIPATVALQELLVERYAEYETCVSNGNMQCTTISSQEVQTQASLSIANLTSTRNALQWACSNRTNNLTAEILNYSEGASNATLIQNGTMMVHVLGSMYSIASNYSWKRILIGDEFKLDLMVLEKWSVVFSTVATNATITFDTFVPPICLIQNRQPVYDTTVYFSGATVANYEGMCDSIVFRVVGSVPGNLQLIENYGIFF